MNNENLAKLKSLVLYKCQIYDEHLYSIKYLTNLLSIDFSYNNLNDPSQYLINLTNLTSLNLSNNNIIDNIFQVLSALTNLTSIDLSNNPRIDDNIFQIMSRLTNLTVLRLSGTSITDHGITFLKYNNILKELIIIRTTISDASIPYLKLIPNLEFLNRYNCQITPEGHEELIDYFEKINPENTVL